MIVLVPGSVDCERGFSVLNQIKDEFRNKIQDDHLESALRIALTKMDPITLAHKYKQELVQKWRRMKDRRTGNKGDRAIIIRNNDGD